MRATRYFSFFTMLLGAVFFGVVPSNAFAHWGHVGELAGHGHWIAVGAGVVGAALAALLGKKNEGEVNEVDTEGAADDVTDEELEGAAA